MDRTWEEREEADHRSLKREARTTQLGGEGRHQPQRGKEGMKTRREDSRGEGKLVDS